MKGDSGYVWIRNSIGRGPPAGSAILELRSITEAGLKISAVGLGCVTFGREIDQDTSFRLLDHAIGKGINLLDTAESYGGGQTKSLREQQFGIRDDREVSAEVSSSMTALAT